MGLELTKETIEALGQASGIVIGAIGSILAAYWGSKKLNKKPAEQIISKSECKEISDKLSLHTELLISLKHGQELLARDIAESKTSIHDINTRTQHIEISVEVIRERK